MSTNRLTVINNGRCGQNSGIVRERFADDVLRLTPKPDFAFIYIGMNDVINDNFFTPLDKYMDNMKWLIDQSRQGETVPVVCTIHKVNEDVIYAHHPREKFGNETANGKRVRYNTALRHLIVTEGVALADFDSVTKSMPESEFISDGVHLTPAGNRLLARTFFDAIAPRLDGAENIVCVGDSITFGYGNQGAGTAEGDTYPSILRSFSITDARV